MVEPALLYKQMENFFNVTKLGAHTWDEVRTGQGPCLNLKVSGLVKL